MFEPLWSKVLASALLCSVMVACGQGNAAGDQPVDTAGQKQGAAQDAPAPSAGGSTTATASPGKGEEAIRSTISAIAGSIEGCETAASCTMPDELLDLLRGQGLIGAADGDYDYMRYATVKGEASLAGHGIVLVMSEDMRGEYLGCCADPGITLALDRAGDRTALEKFAAANRCAVVDARDDIALGLLAEEKILPRPVEDLLAFSCHERAMRDAG